MSITAATRDAMLNVLDGLATHASLHTGDPGTAGTSEVSGGAPAYARKPITWAAASGGSKTLTATVIFNVPAGTTVTHGGTWTALSGGTFCEGGPLAVAESFGAPGTYELNLVTQLT